MDLRSMDGNPTSIQFVYRHPTRTPSNVPIMVDWREETIQLQPNRIGDMRMRIVNAFVWRRCREILRVSKPDTLHTVGKLQFLEECLPDFERRCVSLTTFGKIIHSNLRYKISKTIRKRSGGKDKLTGKNKQTRIASIYVFYPHDLMMAMEFQMAMWIPWFAREKDSEKTFTQEDFDRWLNMIENEPASSLSTDLLTFMPGEEGGLLEEDAGGEDDDDFVPPQVEEGANHQFVPMNSDDAEWMKTFRNGPTRMDWIQRRFPNGV